MVQQSNNINNSSSTTTTSFYCQFLLPCGWCTRLNRDCPKQYGFKINWRGIEPNDVPHYLYEVTC